MNTFFQNFICIVIAALSFYTVRLIADGKHFSPCGISLPIIKTFPATSSDKVNVVEDANENAKIIATIYARVHYTQMSDAIKNDVIEKAKQLTASVGGNTFILEGEQDPPVGDRSMVFYEIRGRAALVQ